MAWSQTIGLATFPTSDSTDQLISILGTEVALYLNKAVGEAWKKVFNNDNCVVKNVHCCNPILLDEAIGTQLPALFCWRSETEREKFTILEELITSKVNIQLIMPLTPTYKIDNRIQLFEKIGKSIESLIRRNPIINGYSLTERLNVHKIHIKRTKTGEYTSRYVTNPGILQILVELEVQEIVNPADEGCEDLINVENEMKTDDYPNLTTATVIFSDKN